MTSGSRSSSEEVGDGGKSADSAVATGATISLGGNGFSKGRADP